MKKISLLLICSICILLLGGCWDKQELENNTFVVLLGIDKADDTDVIVTVAFPLTQTEGGGLNQGENNGSNEYTIMSVKASTLIEGFNMFSTKLSGPLALYSVKTIVVSQELAEDDMLRQVFSSWRYPEIRNTTTVLISKCKAAEFIEARLKNAVINPLRQEELVLEQVNNSAYYKPVQLLDLIINLKSNSTDGVAMYGGITSKDEDKKNDTQQSDEKGQNENNNKENSQDTEIKKPIKEGYLPGEIPLKAENQSQIAGLAIFRGAKMVSVLNSSEAQTYSMLTQSKTKKILTLPDPLEPNSNIVVEVMPTGKNKIKSSLNNNLPVFDIDVNLKCTVVCIQSEIDYALPQNYNILTEYIKKGCVENMQEFITKIQKESNADILKLGNKLAYKFRTVNEWESYNWPEKYKEAEINLNVNLKIERTGILRP